MKDGTQSGVNGKGPAGEDQFGYLRTKDFDRTVGSVTRRSACCLALSSRGGDIRIGAACIVDQ